MSDYLLNIAESWGWRHALIIAGHSLPTETGDRVALEYTYNVDRDDARRRVRSHVCLSLGISTNFVRWASGKSTINDPAQFIGKVDARIIDIGRSQRRCAHRDARAGRRHRKLAKLAVDAGKACVAR